MSRKTESKDTNSEHLESVLRASYHLVNAKAVLSDDSYKGQGGAIALGAIGYLIKDFNEVVADLRGAGYQFPEMKAGKVLGSFMKARMALVNRIDAPECWGDTLLILSDIHIYLVDELGAMGYPEVKNKHLAPFIRLGGAGGDR